MGILNELNHRMAYLRAVVFRPVQLFYLSVASILGGLALLRDEFLPSDVAAKFKILSFLPHLSAGWWTSIALLAFVLIVLEGAYRSAREGEKNATAVAEKLELICQERPFAYSNMEFDFLERNGFGGPVEVTRMGLIFENRGDRMIRYRIDDVFLSFNGILAKADEKFMSTGSYVQAQSSMTYSFDVSDLVVSGLPAKIEIGFSVEYDNVPPVRRRITRRKILYTLRSIRPVSFHSVIVDEAEE